MSPLPENPPDKLWQVLEQAVGAQYTVLRLLGRGGMGAVYLARERLLERLVAIKVLPSDNAGAESRERFLREARTAAGLNHPGIVSLHSFGELGDTLFYIMRFVDGESLEARLRREGALPAAEVRRILGELTDALAYAHEQGVVHRDIKPDNVLLERVTGRVLLTDFGVARHSATSNTLTGTGVIVGTPQYMSPEQASGDKGVDGRSDLYSVGLIGYRMLAGQLPFAGGSLQETLVQHLTKPPRPVTELVPDAPMDLAGAVMKCLAKDPAARWQDGRSLRFAIATNASESLSLPDEVERLPRSGTRLMGWNYAFLAAMAFVFVFDRDPVWLGAAGAAFVWSLIGIGISVFSATRHGLQWRNALRISFWPWQGWSGWWPRGLRPPGDVWDRLPKEVRRARLSITFLLVTVSGITLPTLVLMFLVVDTEWHTVIGLKLIWLFLLSAGAPIVPTVFVSVGLMRIKKRFGLSDAEVKKLSMEPSAGSRFWERPSISQLLTPAPTDGARPETPAALADAVRDVANKLDPAAGDIARDAVRVANDLASAIRELDAEYTQLNDPAAAADKARVEERLRGLGSAVATESPATNQMRELLRGQLALMADLQARRDAVRTRRDTLLEQLRTLWLHLSALQAQARHPTDSASDLSGRIRELCDSIERRVTAISETEKLTRS